MGSVMFSKFWALKRPRVALLNVGEARGKEIYSHKQTIRYQRDNKHINFIGNIEGRDVLLDKATDRL
jgi:glycerol-3-phosphate acyltransferase PlsX